MPQEMTCCFEGEILVHVLQNLSLREVCKHAAISKNWQSAARWPSGHSQFGYSVRDELFVPENANNDDTTSAGLLRSDCSIRSAQIHGAKASLGHLLILLPQLTHLVLRKVGKHEFSTGSRWLGLIETWLSSIAPGIVSLDISLNASGSRPHYEIVQTPPEGDVVPPFEYPSAVEAPPEFLYCLWCIQARSLQSLRLQGFLFDLDSLFTVLQAPGLQSLQLEDCEHCSIREMQSGVLRLEDVVQLQSLEVINCNMGILMTLLYSLCVLPQKCLRLSHAADNIFWGEIEIRRLLVGGHDVEMLVRQEEAVCMLGWRDRAVRHDDGRTVSYVAPLQFA